MKNLAIIAVAALVNSVVTAGAAPGMLSMGSAGDTITQVKAKKKMHHEKPAKSSEGHGQGMNGMDGMKDMQGMKHGNMKGMKGM